MTLGPVEVLVVSFEESRFTGEILPELAKLVDTSTITIIDGLFVQVGDDGAIQYAEIGELGGNSDVASLNDVIERVDSLISDEDVAELAAGIAPGSSAAILVFEHTWMKPLRDAVVASGGVLEDTVRIPGVVVEEVLAAVSELDD